MLARLQDRGRTFDVYTYAWFTSVTTVTNCCPRPLSRLPLGRPSVEIRAARNIHDVEVPTLRQMFLSRFGGVRFFAKPFRFLFLLFMERNRSPPCVISPLLRVVFVLRWMRAGAKTWTTLTRVRRWFCRVERVRANDDTSGKLPPGRAA